MHDGGFSQDENVLTQYRMAETKQQVSPKDTSALDPIAADRCSNKRRLPVTLSKPGQ